MSVSTTPALRAHLRLREQLQHHITTHHAKSPVIDRRGKNMKPLDRLTRSRNGRANGPKAKFRTRG